MILVVKLCRRSNISLRSKRQYVQTCLFTNFPSVFLQPLPPQIFPFSIESNCACSEAYHYFHSGYFITLTVVLWHVCIINGSVPDPAMDLSMFSFDFSAFGYIHTLNHFYNIQVSFLRFQMHRRGMICTKKADNYLPSFSP